MSKSVPSEQMVLEAGDQPFPHLNLDSAAHHSQPGVGKEASLLQAKNTSRRPCEGRGFIHKRVKVEKKKVL